MTVPEIIPIAYEPDYRTSTIGQFAEGQFLASTTYGFPEGQVRGDGWENKTKLFAVLHKFDLDGQYTGSDIWCAGTWAEQMRRPLGAQSVLARAEQRMERYLEGLPQRKYGNIAIRPFQLIFDGVLFGLVTECHAENEEGEHDWAELYPDSLGFCAPWDGRYST